MGRDRLDGADVLFYAYKKEVKMFQETAINFPPNFRYLFSTGGLQDHLIDVEKDRHADVFPSLDEIVESGYQSQDVSDLLAVLLPTTKIGIPQNNIPKFRKKMGSDRFSTYGSRETS